MTWSMRFFGRPALLVGFLAAGLGVAAAQDGTQEQRQACTGDAMRLCSDAIPDVAKITKCMVTRYKELSEPCRMAMRHGSGARRAFRHHRPTYARASS